MSTVFCMGVKRCIFPQKEMKNRHQMSPMNRPTAPYPCILPTSVQISTNNGYSEVLFVIFAQLFMTVVRTLRQIRVSLLSSLHLPNYLLLVTLQVHCNRGNCPIWVHIWSTKRVQLKSKLNHTETCPATAWPPNHLCYRPAIFLGHYCLTVLSFLHRNFRRAFKHCFISLLIL